MTKSLHKIVLRCVVATLALTPFQLWAQEGVLEEIIVTSQNREEDVQNIALSVTALTPGILADNGITNMIRLSHLVPGMNLSQSGNDPRMAIRGARTEGVLAGQDPAISVYVDGIYRSQTSQFMTSIIDVQRVEVLRGPQGTLFGRNSFGGAVHVISNKPDASAFDFGTNVWLGEYARVRSDGFINFPIGDSSAFRLAWVKDTHEGKIENISPGGPDIRDRDEDYLRGQFAFEFGDSVDLRLAASYWSSDGNGNADFGHHYAGLPLDSTGTLSTTEGVLTPSVMPPPACCSGTTLNLTDPFKIQGDGPYLQDNDQITFDAELNWDVGFANITFLFGYADYDRIMCADGEFSPFNGIGQCEIDFAETFTEEITITSLGDGPFEWTAGLFFLQEDKQSTFALSCLHGFGAGNLPDLTIDNPYPDCFTSQDQIETDSIAVYGQAAYTFMERFELRAGVRYTEDDKDYAGGNNFDGFFGGPGGPGNDPEGLFGCCTVGGTIYDPIVLGTRRTDDATFDETTWMVSASWFVNDDVMTYAMASTGFQSGGFNNGPHPVTGEFDFDTQTVDAYEIGLKTTLLDGRMTLNLAAYRNEYEDLLAQEFVVVGGGVLTVNSNAGAVEATGLEIEMDYLPTENLYLGIRANFSDSEYQNFVLGGEGFPDTIDADGNSVIDLDGVQVQQTPDATLNIASNYTFSIGDKGTLRPHINIYWSDDYSANDRHRPWEIQDSYVVIDLRLFWESVDQHWVAEAFVENVGDEEVLQRSVGFGGGATIEDYKDPSTWGLRLGYHY
jgi:iron complex outermembrane receptor protein